MNQAGWQADGRSTMGDQEAKSLVFLKTKYKICITKLISMTYDDKHIFDHQTTWNTAHSVDSGRGGRLPAEGLGDVYNIILA